MTSPTRFPLPDGLPRALALLALCLAAYLPAFDNGFISDDYVNLEHARHIWTDPLRLLDFPPQNFRVTTFLGFSLVEALAGYEAPFFYALSLLVHFLNCLLLARLLRDLAWEPREAFLAACLFAVFQAPQEAVMWLSAIAESLVAMAILGVLLFWLRGRTALALAAYCLALVSKESAPVVLALVALVDWHRGRPPVTRRHALFLIPTAGFGITFVLLWQANLILQRGAYAFGVSALVVLALSLHRLIWPWLYVLIALSRATRGRWPEGRVLAGAAGLILVCMLPYAFLTYESWLSSRHVYLASMVLSAAMARLLVRLPSARLRQAFVGIFLVFNVLYIHLRKDAQFEERAAPTTVLVELLATRDPGPVMLYDFAYPYPEIPKALPIVLPGWRPEMIRVEGVDPDCDACLRLRWDPSSARYLEF